MADKTARRAMNRSSFAAVSPLRENATGISTDYYHSGICSGEAAGGFSQHGLARATCQGYIAGHHAVLA
jgi:hypothetical protein